MPQYCHNPPLGTIPNAKIRIRMSSDSYFSPFSDSYNSPL